MSIWEREKKKEESVHDPHRMKWLKRCIMDQSEGEYRGNSILSGKRVRFMSIWSTRKLCQSSFTYISAHCSLFDCSRHLEWFHSSNRFLYPFLDRILMKYSRGFVSIQRYSNLQTVFPISLVVICLWWIDLFLLSSSFSHHSRLFLSCHSVGIALLTHPSHLSDPPNSSSDLPPSTVLYRTLPHSTVPCEWRRINSHHGNFSMAEIRRIQTVVCQWQYGWRVSNR